MADAAAFICGVLFTFAAEIVFTVVWLCRKSGHV